MSRWSRFSRKVRRSLARRHAIRRMRRVVPIADHQGGREGGITLFFSPEAGVEPHFVGHCVLARTLQELGHRVLLARCFQVFPRCTVMAMYRRPIHMSPRLRCETCGDCAAASYRMAESYGLESLDIRSCLSDDVRARVQAVMDTAPSDLRELEYAGIAFGKLCMSDIALSRKICDYEQVSDETREAWIASIHSSVLSFEVVREACRQHPIERVVYFNDYPINLGARLAAEAAGISVLSFTFASHRNVDRRRYLVRHKPWYLSVMSQQDGWHRWKDLPLPDDAVTEVAEDLLSRFGARGSHQYSPPKTAEPWNVHEALGLSRDRRLLVAFTSSLDEAVAVKTTCEAMGTTAYSGPNPFSSQVEWLRYLMQLVASRDDLQLVVRVHPREGAEPRQPVEAEHLPRLREVAKEAGPHCRFIWPNERISSYDLAESADVALTAWSNMGAELSRVGIPLLAGFRGTTPFASDDFIQWASDREEYGRKLEALLSRPLTMDLVAGAFRWYSAYHLGRSVLLGDLIPSGGHDGLPEFRLPERHRVLEQLVVGGQDAFEWNLQRLRGRQHPDSPIEERLALSRSLRRIIHFVLTGALEDRDFDLTVQQVSSIDGAVPGGQDPLGARRLEVCGNEVRYLVGGRSYRRYSPMVARLAPVCGQLREEPMSTGLTDHGADDAAA